MLLNTDSFGQIFAVVAETSIGSDADNVQVYDKRFGESTLCATQMRHQFNLLVFL